MHSQEDLQHGRQPDFALRLWRCFPRVRRTHVLARDGLIGSLESSENACSCTPVANQPCAKFFATSKSSAVHCIGQSPRCTDLRPCQQLSSSQRDQSARIASSNCFDAPSGACIGQVCKKKSRCPRATRRQGIVLRQPITSKSCKLCKYPARNWCASCQGCQIGRDCSCIMLGTSDHATMVRAVDFALHLLSVAMRPLL